MELEDPGLTESDFAAAFHQVLQGQVKISSVKEIEFGFGFWRRRWSNHYEGVARGAKIGDMALVNFRGYSNDWYLNDFEGVPGSLSKQTRFALKIGPTSLVPESQRLVGLRAGQDFHFDFRFPNTFPISSVAGQKVLYRCNMLEIREAHNQTLKPGSDLRLSRQDLQDIPVGLRTALLRTWAAKRKRQVQHRILDLLLADGQRVRVPGASLVKKRMYIVRGLSYELEMAGGRELIKSQFSDIQQKASLLAEQLSKAEHLIKVVAKAQNIAVDQIEFKQYLHELAAAYLMTPAKLNCAVLRTGLTSELIQELLIRKVLNLLGEKAEVIERPGMAAETASSPTVLDALLSRRFQSHWRLSHERPVNLNGRKAERLYGRIAREGKRLAISSRERLSDDVIARSTCSLPRSNPVEVVTLSNGPSRYFLSFLRSCEKAGVTPNILDPGPDYSPFTLGGVKWKALHEYLCRASGTKYCMFVDSHDLIFVQCIERIMEKFAGFQAPLVISAESDCWPYKRLIQRHPITADPYRFVNSGGFLGDRDFLISVLEAMGVSTMPDQGNDQGQLATYYCEHPERIRLDSKGEIWTVLQYAEDAIEIEGENIRNRLSGVYPSVLHANGGTRLNHIIDYLKL